MNHCKCAALIMAFEVLDVLQHECGGLMVVEYLCDGEKEIALLLIIEPMFPAETVFLGYPSETEWLTWKTTAQNIVGRHVSDGNSVNITMGFFAEIRRVRYLRMFIPIGGEHALASDFFESDAKATNTTEEIDEL